MHILQSGAFNLRAVVIENAIDPMNGKRLKYFICDLQAA
jgi:hypothetical protein